MSLFGAELRKQLKFKLVVTTIASKPNSLLVTLWQACCEIGLCAFLP